MLGKLDKWGPMTALVVIVVTVAVVAGAVVVIARPETLTFEDYLNVLWKFGAVAAAMGGARALNLAGEKIADAHAFKQDLALDDELDVAAAVAVPRSEHTRLKG